MLNDVTLRNFEDRFQLVQSKAKDTVQSAHCAMKVSLYRRYELLSNSKSIGGDGPSMLQLIHFLHKNQDTDSHTINGKFALSSSFLQTLPVPGRSGACGQFVNPVRPIARSSDSATATTLLRLLPVLANQLRRLLAQSLLT